MKTFERPGSRMIADDGREFVDFLAGAGEVEATLDLAAEASRLVERHPALELARPESLNTVLFRYVGDRSCGPAELDLLNDAIRSSLLHGGQAVIARTRLDSRVYLKLTLMYPATTADELRELLTLVAVTGWYLQPLETAAA